MQIEVGNLVPILKLRIQNKDMTTLTCIQKDLYDPISPSLTPQVELNSLVRHLANDLTTKQHNSQQMLTNK